MTRGGVLSVGVLAALLAVGGLVLQSCGSNDNKRTRDACEVCDGHIDEDCRSECRTFCLPTEDCEERCTRQCDQCTKDLTCQACAADCTGAELRCASIDEVVTCEDGRFGERPEASPLPTPTAPTATLTIHVDPTPTPPRATSATATPTPTI